MKQCGLIVSSFVLLASLFRWWNADLSNNVLILASMILLISLFTDLKEFDFWGLKGKSKEQEFKNLEGAEAINESSAPKPDSKKVLQAQQENTIQLMEPSSGNFLMIAFEIERLLKIAASIVFDPSEIQKGLTKTKKLEEKGLLTDDGVKQVEAVRWLRNMFVHGRLNEVSQETINTGVQVAWNFYNELNNWINSSSQDK